MTSSETTAITIRRVEVKDAAALARTMGDPEVFPGLLQVPYATEERWKQRLTDNPGPTALDLFLVAEMNGEVVGNAGLHPAGPALRRRHVANLGIAVLPEFQGRGVGRALMNALIDYADNWVHILRLELTVYADNEQAIRLYKACGFEVEGLMRAYALRAGEFADTLAMARLHPNPPRLPTPGSP